MLAIFIGHSAIPMHGIALLTTSSYWYVIPFIFYGMNLTWITWPKLHEQGDFEELKKAPENSYQ